MTEATLPTPSSTTEEYLAVLADQEGATKPASPSNTVEQYLDYLCDHHGSATFEAIVAWDGTATPDVTKIPAGIKVTYESVEYTGTLVASSTTAGKIYLVRNTEGTTPNIYKEYLTVGSDNSNYIWEMIGTTELNLTDYVSVNEQSFTAAQQAQARENIDAWTFAEYDSTATPADRTIYYVED